MPRAEKPRMDPKRPELPVSYLPRYVARVTSESPKYATQEHTRLLQWLNYEHVGSAHPPEEVTKEHEDAHYALARHYEGRLFLELQKDGRSVPYKLEYGGSTFMLVPVPKP